MARNLLESSSTLHQSARSGTDEARHLESTKTSLSTKVYFKIHMETA